MHINDPEYFNQLYSVTNKLDKDWQVPPYFMVLIANFPYIFFEEELRKLKDFGIVLLLFHES